MGQLCMLTWRKILPGWVIPRRWPLQATFLAIMAGSAFIGLAAAIILIWSIRAANDNLERAADAQSRLEYFLQLSGRVSDYGITALQSIQLTAMDRTIERLTGSVSAVEQVFETLDDRISTQVNAAKDDNEQAAIATKGLGLARMRAQFRALHRQVNNLIENPLEDEEATGDRAQNLMNVFGVQFAPLLAQAIEDERQEIQGARTDMALLRSRIVIFGIALIVFATLIAILLYFLAGRPILRRISETMAGARELTAGRLQRRVKPGGRDELTLLMTQFNRMAGQLEQREKKLLEAQRDLQSTIADQTQDLRKSNERLEQIDSQRRQFFSDVSHELRTPLTVILGESDLALKNPDALGPDLAASVATIKARGENLRRRVDDLLRVARSESGQLDLRFGIVDLNLVCRDAVSETQPLAVKYDIAINFDEADQTLKIRGDPDWMRQVISGILTNAIRYGDTSSPVSIVGGQDGQIVTLSITDRGPGIPTQERPHLFKRFYRGESSEAQTEKRGERGFGIGLSLIKWVVDEHDGRINVETNDGIDPTSNAPEHTGSRIELGFPVLPNTSHPDEGSP